jgi:predicted O-methyltransferase YrrM
MNILSRLLACGPVAPPSAQPADPVRPPTPIASPTGHPSDIRSLVSTPAYGDALAYFTSYPPRSVMSDHSRAVLYALARTMQPRVVAEVGTMYAGTAEVMARALWENGAGILHTTDPLGGDRCPTIIARWPEELQQRVRFHPLSSMDFFHHLDRQRLTLDLVLVDGNHDYEFALFDLQMAARLMRPGGIVVMDNAEQTGPFKASRQFLRLNPAWRELGMAVASHDRSAPFDAARASLPGTSFIVLQAPDHVVIGEDPATWGQVSTKVAHFDGIRLELAPQRTAGWLHYQALLRAFQEDGAIPEHKTVGKVRLDIDGAGSLAHRFDTPMRFPEGVQYTYEIDLAWEPDAGSPPLQLVVPPKPVD